MVHVKPPVSDVGRDDFERLLSLAEELREKTESGRRLIETYRSLELALVAVAMAGLIGIFSVQESDTRTLLGIAAAVVTLYLFVTEMMVSRARRRVAPDRKAMAEVIGILRETEGAIAIKRDWSPLDRAEFRIRLSRFDIGSARDSSADAFFR